MTPLATRATPVLISPTGEDGHGCVDSPDNERVQPEARRHPEPGQLDRYFASTSCNVESEIRRALEGDQLWLAYQPIVVTSSGRVIGAEALLRWSHPVLGPVPPATLIPLVEQCGLSSEVGQWVLERACGEARHWIESHRPGEFGVAVNVSADQLKSSGFATSVENVLRKARISPRSITLELTESRIH